MKKNVSLFSLWNPFPRVYRGIVVEWKASSTTIANALAIPGTNLTNVSLDGNATILDNSTSPDDPKADPPPGQEAQLAFDMDLPEIFAYVWVVGGSICVCCSVMLFIHRSNFLTGLFKFIPCLKCCVT